jgi:hypothetical protein
MTHPANGEIPRAMKGAIKNLFYLFGLDVRRHVQRPRHAMSTQNRTVILLTESVSKRKLPANLKEGDLELFSHELERVIPETKLLELRNVRVNPDGILFKRGRILPESFAFPLSRANWTGRSILKFIAGNYLFRRRRTFPQKALWIVDDWSYGYFHWLTDALPRLFVVKDRLDDLVLLLPSRYKTLEFVQPSLKALGAQNVEFINDDEVLVCEKLIMPLHTAPSGNYHEETMKRLCAQLLSFYGSHVSSDRVERIYISRSRAPKRRIINEEELAASLREFGFRTIHAEDHSFEEQVQIASTASHLISNHGAGLTNMLFMKPGGSVLELRHMADRVNNCYFALSSALGLNYYYQTSPSEPADEDSHTANLLVDIPTLVKNLKRMEGL